MSEVGAYEAKTHFAALLKRVERGERITITRHGHPVAVLAPATDEPELTADQAITELLALRKGNRLGPDLTIRDLINEGRK